MDQKVELASPDSPRRGEPIFGRGTSTFFGLIFVGVMTLVFYHPSGSHSWTFESDRFAVAAGLAVGLLALLLGLLLIICACSVWPLTLILVVTCGFVGHAEGAIAGLMFSGLVGLGLVAWKARRAYLW